MQIVRSILSDYLLIFPDEWEQLTQLNGLIDSSFSDSELFSRQNFIGHITASGFVISRSKSKVLLIYHKTLCKFLQPGGHIEAEENSPLEAALREVKEETSITALKYLPLNSKNEVPIDIDTHLIPENNSKNEPTHWHHDFRYLFICNNENQEVTIDKSESIEYQWIDIKEIQRMNSFFKVAEKIKKAMEKGMF